MRWSRLLFFPPLLVLALFFSAPNGEAPVEFTHGVASGDVRSFSAVLWTRVDKQAALAVDVSKDPSFPPGATMHRATFAAGKNDFTARSLVFPLQPDRTYHYRFRAGASTSETGAFRTAPLPLFPRDVRFAYSGDSDGTIADGVRPFGDFLALDAARGEDLDFFVYLGDTIYSDSGLRPAPAETIQEYRDAYKVNRDVPALQDILKTTSTYAIWDDHEVRNDYDGQTVDPARYATGREAFLEYMPALALRLPDADCADDPLFRWFRWGSDADIIILDERSCRSGDAEPSCLVEVGPAELVPDLAPTLPPLLRQAFSALLPDDLKPLLQPQPPDGCVDAINDPSRTMLGDAQKELLKRILLHSHARFKFIVNGLPIQQFYALPYDRWEGYAAERTEVLEFIRDHDVGNVVFLTTDTHANLINEVALDRFGDPEPIADEFVTGPIATNTFEEELREAFGGGPPGDLGVFAFNVVLEIVGVDCRHLDAFSYGLVEVDVSEDAATVTLKDETGAALHDQLDGSIACAKTIGP